MLKTGLAIAAAALLAGLSLPALAHECEGCPAGTTFGTLEWNLSFYVGAGFLQSQFEDWDAVSQIDSGSFTSRSEDDSDAGFRLSAGVDFLEHFGVELTYADFGEATFTGQSDGSGAILAPGTQRDSAQVDGFTLHLIARVPVGKDFSLAGRGGLGMLKARQHLSGTVYNPGPTPSSFSNSESSMRLSWGAGLDYDAFKPVRVSVEYQAATFKAPFTEDLSGASDIRALGLSVAYLF